MPKLSLLSCFLLTFALVQSNATQNHPSPPSPAPAPHIPPSCGVLMFKMIECLPYLTKRSNMSEPVNSCCSGLKEVWKLDSNCVCEALKGSVKLGFQLNMTRVVHVSSSCGFRRVSMDKCLPNLLEARPPVQSIKPSPATPSTRTMAMSAAASSSLSNFFRILMNMVAVLIF